MAFTVQLIEGSEDPINLFYLVDDGWSMLDRGFQPNDPERIELWAGWLQTILVRQEDGKRSIPLRLFGQWSTPDELIDAVNALEARLRHAAAFRVGGTTSGYDEVFLRFQLHDATFGVDFPVCSGLISKAELLQMCNAPMDAGGHRELTRANSIGVTLVCEPYWEATTTYVLNNMIDNPGFWRGAAAPGDSWTEVDPAAALTLAWNTTIWEKMGRSLEWTIAPDAINSPGIDSDNYTVTAATRYYFQCRGYHTAGCDRITAYVYDNVGAAPIAASVLYFDNQDDDWETLGVAFDTPAGCNSVRITMNRNAADSTAGNKTFYCDAFYLEERSDAPTGWCSGRNLINHLDAGADHLNVLCVSEIPGEREAEVEFTIFMGDDTEDLYMAKRAKPDTHNFIWELLPVDAVVTAGDAACIDSALQADAAAPGGQRIHVSFATNTGMVLRCYWELTANLVNYFDRYTLGLLAKKTGVTDNIWAELQARQSSSLWAQGREITQAVPVVTTHDWNMMTGWELFSFPIGDHIGVFDAGDYWRLNVYAQSSDATPPGTDSLRIGGLYLIPLDAAAMLCGGDSYFATPVTFYVRQLDQHNGAYVWSDVANKRYPAIRHVGILPTLTPKVENWFYFATMDAGELDITDLMTVSLEYRPRGIFLRGSNP